MKNRIHSTINRDDEEAFTLNLTPRVSQRSVFDSIISNLNKIKKGVYGSQENKKFIMFIDNLGLPEPDESGDQPPIEVIHQLMDHKFMYEPDTFEKVELRHSTIISCMTSEVGQEQKLSERTLRHFHAVSTTPAIDESINKIFSTKFNMFFKTRGFQPEAAGVIGPIIQSSVLVYNTMKKSLLPVPEKSHYIFDLNDIAKLMDGCLLLPKELSDNKKMYTRIWVHECLRVFSDRLVAPEDSNTLFEKIKHCVKTIFRENFDSAFEHLGKVDGFVTEYNLRNLTFGDFIEVEGKKCYQEIISFDEFSKQGVQIMDEFVSVNPSEKTDFIFFKYTMENVCKICRVFSQPAGNIILLGEGGTGREYAARAAAVMKKAKFFSPPISNSFTFMQWRDQIKILLKEAGANGTCCVFFITSEILENEDFLQDINTLLTNGEIEDIFSGEEKHVLTDQMYQYMKENKLETDKELTPAELYSRFIKRCMTNFHMVFKLEEGKQFDHLIRTYPEFQNKSVLCYFTEWPDDALQKSAELIFEDLPVSRELRRDIIQFSKEFYFIAKQKALDLRTERGQNIEISPSSYLGFIRFFSELYQNKHSEVSYQRKNYDGAIMKYDAIQSEIETLETDLVDLESQAVTLKEELQSIEEKREKEGVKLQQLTEDLVEEEKKVAVEQGKLDEIQEDVDKEFRPVLKKFEDCKLVLNAFQTSDFQQPLSIKKPSNAVKKTIGSVALLLGKEPNMIPDPNNKKKDAEPVADYWGPGKKMLSDPSLKENILSFELTTISKEVLIVLKKDFTSDNSFEPTTVAKTSQVGEALCKWVKCIDEFTNIDVEIEDKKSFLQEAKSAFEDFKMTYKEKKRLVNDQDDLMSNLKQKAADNREKQKEVNDEIDFSNLKISRGKEIIKSFEPEKVWWETEKSTKEQNLDCILGDLLLIATMVCYLSAFSRRTRKETLEKFCEMLAEKEIRFSDNKTRISLFLSEMKIKQWEKLGLPSQEFYIINGLMLSICSRWPLIIDPELQATNWIRNIEESIMLIDASDINLIKKISQNVSSGINTIIYNVRKTIDSNLDNLLMKKIYTKANEKFLLIGNTEVSYNPDFRLYLTSKNEQFEFSSRIQNHLTIINFVPVSSGLQDHLLRIVVGKERADLKQKRDAAMRQFSEATVSLVENRERVLDLLLHTEGNILENKTAFEELQKCIQCITEHLQKIEKVKVHQEKIFEIELEYAPIAKHATVLFQTIRKLKSLNHMYRFSLQWFSNLYTYSIDNSNKSKQITKRLRYLGDHLTFNSFLQVSRSIFNKDRRAFSFLLCIDLMIYKEKLGSTDFEILLNEPFEDNSASNPSKDWLSDETWNYINLLKNVEAFTGIVEDFKVHNENWKMIYDAKEPDDLPLHEPWHSKLSKFHRLVVIKMLRPDKMTELLDTFISEHLGFKFVEPLSFDLGRILADTGPRVPMIFLMNSTEDPLRMVKRLKQERDDQAVGGSLTLITLYYELEEVIMKTVETAFKVSFSSSY